MSFSKKLLFFFISIILLVATVAILIFSAEYISKNKLIGLSYNKILNKKFIRYRLRSEPWYFKKENKDHSLIPNINGFTLPDTIFDYPHIKIAFLGSSVLESLNTPLKNRIPNILCNELYTKHNIKSNIINASKGGNTLIHSINIFYNQILSDSLDVLFVMHNANDLYLLQVLGSYWNNHDVRSNIYQGKNNFYDELIRKKLSKKGTAFQKTFPFLYERAHYFIEKHINKKTTIDEWDGYRGKKTIDFKRNINEYKKQLYLLGEMCDIFNVKLVCLTQPRSFTSIQSNPKNLYINNNPIQFTDLHDGINEVIKSICIEKNWDYIDLSSEFKKTGLHKTGFYDSYHFNSDGNVLTSTIISKYISKYLKEK